MPESLVYDVIIVGGGPAGFTASVYAARGGRKTLMIAKLPGGQTSLTALIENYPAILSISGLDFTERMREQAIKWGVEVIEFEEALRIVPGASLHKVITDSGEYVGKTVIISTGAEHRRLDVKGIDEYEGRGISYCATCDGAFFKDKEVAVVGGGNTALTEALYLVGLAKRVHLIHRRKELRAEAILVNNFLKHPKAVLHWDTVVTGFQGKDSITGVSLMNLETQKAANLPIDGVFIAIGFLPQSKIAADCGITTNENTEIVVNEKQETNIPGIFAAGDVTPGVRQIATAVGEGCKAAIFADEYINRRNL